MTSRAAGTGGFTLIELIVGLAVSSIAIAAGFATLALVQDRGGAAEEANRAALSGATQRAMLMDWLASARYESPTGAVFQGLDAEDGRTPIDELVFPTMARTALGNASTVVRLYIDGDPETEETGLVAELIGTALGAETRLIAIAPSAAGMDARYLPEADGSGEWLDEWMGRDALPRGVEIRLVPAEGDSLPALLRLPVRVALPSAR